VVAVAVAVAPAAVGSISFKNSDEESKIYLHNFLDTNAFPVKHHQNGTSGNSFLHRSTDRFFN